MESGSGNRHSEHAHLVLLSVRLGLGEGHSCSEDTQNQRSHPAGMSRDVSSAAEVIGLEQCQLGARQL